LQKSASKLQISFSFFSPFMFVFVDHRHRKEMQAKGQVRFLGLKNQSRRSNRNLCTQKPVQTQKHPAEAGCF